MSADMTENDAVLAANLEFYRAFTMGDVAGMEALWARRAPVLCAHPGWMPITGREAVMQAWHDILTHPQPTHVMVHDERAYLYGETALVTCEEELANGHLVATNFFIKEDGAWRLVHHHSGPIIARSYGDRPQRPH